MKQEGHLEGAHGGGNDSMFKVAPKVLAHALISASGHAWPGIRSAEPSVFSGPSKVRAKKKLISAVQDKYFYSSFGP